MIQEDLVIGAAILQIRANQGGLQVRDNSKFLQFINTLYLLKVGLRWVYSRKNCEGPFVLPTHQEIIGCRLIVEKSECQNGPRQPICKIGFNWQAAACYTSVDKTFFKSLSGSY